MPAQIETDKIRLRALEYVASKLRNKNPDITATSLNTHLDGIFREHREWVDEVEDLIRAAVEEDMSDRSIYFYYQRIANFPSGAA